MYLIVSIMLILHIAYADYNIKQEAVSTMFVESVWMFFFIRVDHNGIV